MGENVLRSLWVVGGWGRGDPYSKQVEETDGLLTCLQIQFPLKLDSSPSLSIRENQTK